MTVLFLRGSQFTAPSISRGSTTATHLWQVKRRNSCSVNSLISPLNCWLRYKTCYELPWKCCLPLSLNYIFNFFNIFFIRIFDNAHSLNCINMLYNISYYLRFSTVLCYCSFPLSCALWPERGIVAKAVIVLIYV